MRIFLIILVFLTIFSCSNLDKRIPDSLDNDIISVNEISKEAWKKLSQKEQEQVIQLNKNVAKFLLQSTYKSKEEKLKLFRNAQAYYYDGVVKITSNIKNRKTNNPNFKELLDPPRWTLEDEVEWMVDQVKITNPAAYNIDFSQYMSLLSNVQLEELDGVVDHELLSAEDIKSFLVAIKSEDSSNEVPLALMNSFENKVTVYFDKIRNVGSELEKSGEVDIPNEEAKKFFVKFLDYYYSNVDISIIKNILNDLVDLGHKPSQMEMVSVMFRNSGPGLGKTLQQLAKDPTVGGAIKDIASFLEDDGKAVPLYLIERIVKKDKANFKIKDISVNPLGTGTMAQVNKAKLTQNGDTFDVALRFLKPGIEQRVDDDLKILSDFIEQMGNEGELSEDFMPSARKLVESISQFLRSELSISDAIKKQDFGHKVYTQALSVKVGGEKVNINIRVPKVYYPDNGKPTNLHVQEFITFGEKFSKIKDQEIKEAVARGIMEAWFTEALIKSGFIHSDLHQGNFTVTNITKNSAEVVLFDFGMSERLTLETRRSFILIGAGVKLGKPSLITDGILMMDSSEYDAKFRKEFLKKITDEMGNHSSTEEWIVWALKEGYLKNDQLGTLARGGVLVSQLGKIIEKDELHEDIVEKILLKNSLRTFSKNSNYPLTKFQLMRIGTASCLNSIKSFFSRSK